MNNLFIIFNITSKKLTLDYKVLGHSGSLLDGNFECIGISVEGFIGSSCQNAQHKSLATLALYNFFTFLAI